MPLASCTAAPPHSAARSLRLVSARRRSNRVVSDACRSAPLRSTPCHSIRVVSDACHSVRRGFIRLVSSTDLSTTAAPLRTIQLVTARFVSSTCRSDPFGSHPFVSPRSPGAPLQTKFFPILSNRVPIQTCRSSRILAAPRALRAGRFTSGPLQSVRIASTPVLPFGSDPLVSIRRRSACLPILSIPDHSNHVASYSPPILSATACRFCSSRRRLLTSPHQSFACPSDPSASHRLGLRPLHSLACHSSRVASRRLFSSRFSSTPLRSITCRSFHIPSRPLQSLSSPILSFTCHSASVASTPRGIPLVTLPSPAHRIQSSCVASTPFRSFFLPHHSVQLAS